MERITNEESEGISYARIPSKLPPWLLEMSEAVKKLKLNDSIQYKSPDALVKSDGFLKNPLDKTINHKEKNRTEEKTLFAMHKLKEFDCNIFLQSTAKSLPNPPKHDINRSSEESNRTFFTLHDIYQAEKERNQMSRLDKYLNDQEAKYKFPDSHFRTLNSFQYPAKERDYKKHSTKSKTQPYLPIGIIKRKLDYLSGFAPKVKNSNERMDTHVNFEDKFFYNKRQKEHEIVNKDDQRKFKSSKDELREYNPKFMYHYEDGSPKDRTPKEDFIIPELPCGRSLTINIFSTWGDKHYVGLNGIEIFSDSGKPVVVEKIHAQPSDVNELPDHSNDPRVISNLVNGINRTRDDFNLWLAPFTGGNDHLIYMQFNEAVHIAMIRIWNYNKSRIHSYRGAKDVLIQLDGITIFDGEIARASGDIFGSIDSFGDTILFTTDETILQLISENDQTFDEFNPISDFDRDADKEIERPITGTEISSEICAANQSVISGENDNNGISIACKEIQLLLCSNWGLFNMIGLTGIEFTGDQDTPISLAHAKIYCNTGNDNLMRLSDGHNLTTDGSHMWATQFSLETTVIITIQFNTEIFVNGMRVWNYNSSLDFSYCGVKKMIVRLDGKPVFDFFDGFLLRRAPGCCQYDFVQEISFINPPTSQKILPNQHSLHIAVLPEDSTNNDMDYEAPLIPQGFVYQIAIFSTWGDPYYVGLNGIEMYDAQGFKIELTKDNIAAYPESVNIIEGIDNDVRTPDKLIDSVNNSRDGQHSWLAPILPEQV
ncbi:protein KIAA0556-like isoform X2 [Belonocnema kinseyi]|uniref:protein KIAA0556-like isoform X2 n=1 Tax=Belonocnema kinseyi TaxID=2817044 RepID=UPI00143CE8B4|nr:protein KIAA0556-like isoform X2 [Belonocnema kinseyi]